MNAREQYPKLIEHYNRLLRQQEFARTDLVRNEKVLVEIQNTPSRDAEDCFCDCDCSCCCDCDSGFDQAKELSRHTGLVVELRNQLAASEQATKDAHAAMLEGEKAANAEQARETKCIQMTTANAADKLKDFARQGVHVHKVLVGSLISRHYGDKLQQCFKGYKTGACEDPISIRFEVE